MIKDGYINFDAVVWTHRRTKRKTNVVGRIEALPFKDDSFDHIFCAHVLEHFTYWDAQDLLQKMYALTKVGGTCTIETPCIVGAYEFYVVKHNNIKKYVETLYGAIWKRSPHGEFYIHKFGWTKELLAAEMTQIGFTILNTGVGLSHGMGKRDLRVHARR